MNKCRHCGTTEINEYGGCIECALQRQEIRMNNQLFNVLTERDDEHGRYFETVDANLERSHAEFLRNWHSETIGNTYHWIEPAGLLPDAKIKVRPAFWQNGIDDETVERNEYEEHRLDWPRR